MPPAKKTTAKATKKTTRKPAKRATKRPAQRTLSASHKRALAEGRTMSATVNRYLAAVNRPKRRGRKVSKATLVDRLAEARLQAKTATGIDKVMAAQAVRDLQRKVTQLNATGGADIKGLEAAFVKVAKQFSRQRGISYGAWRDAGVPAETLKRSGVVRTRG
jgi:hypothetical protein